MTKPIPVRRPRLDPGAGFEPLWLGDDAFRTQVFNALSMSFPIGEKYFIDTLRESLPQVADAALEADIRGYIGQEAVHSRLHRELNTVLATQGLRKSHRTPGGMADSPIRVAEPAQPLGDRNGLRALHRGVR